MSPRTRHPRVVGCVCRLYGLMIWAYPPNLRRDYKRELIITFRNQAEDVLNSGTVSAAVLFLLHIAADWLHTHALGRQESATLSVLGLGAEGDEACGCIDPSTFSTSLLLATLGIALLIAGWYEWFRFNAVILSHHRVL